MMPDDTKSDASDGDVRDAPARIAPLSRLDDYEIADGYPEVRGWEVRDAADRAIGRVHDLLVDITALRVRYLDVELAPNFAQSDADRRVLIPVERADLDGTGDHVLLPGIDVADVRGLVPHARRGLGNERASAPPTPVADRQTPEDRPT
jgi:photosynthetic reaction center H subunit